MNDINSKFELFADLIGDGNIFASADANALVGNSTPTGVHRAVVLRSTTMEERYIAALTRSDDPDIPQGLGVWRPESETEEREGYRLRLYPSRAPVLGSGTLDIEQIKEIATGLSDAVLSLDGCGIDPIRPWNVVAGHMESDISLFAESRTIYETAGFERPIWRSARNDYLDLAIDRCATKLAGGDAYLFIYDTAFMMPSLWRMFTEERTDAAPYRLRNVRSWALTVAALPSQMTDWNILKGLSTSVSMEQFVKTPTWHETIYSMVQRMVNINREMLPDWNWEKLLLRTEDDCLEEFDRVYRSLHNGAGIAWRGPVRPEVERQGREEQTTSAQAITISTDDERPTSDVTVSSEEKAQVEQTMNDVPVVGSPFVSPFIPSPTSPFSNLPSPFLSSLGSAFDQPQSLQHTFPTVVPIPDNTSAFGIPLNTSQEQSMQKQEEETGTNDSISDRILNITKCYLVVGKDASRDASDIDVSEFERLRIREKIRSVAGMVFLSTSPEEYYDDLTGDESIELLRKAGWGKWIPILFEAASQKIGETERTDSEIENVSHNVWVSCYAMLFSGVAEFAWRSVVCTRSVDKYGRTLPEIANFFKSLKAEMDAFYATRSRAEAEALRTENNKSLASAARFYVAYRADFPFLDGADPYSEDASIIADLATKFGLESLFWAFNREWVSDPTSELMDLEPDILNRFKRLCTERLDGERNPILPWDAYAKSHISEAAHDAVSKYADKLEQIDRDRAEREHILEETRNAPLVILHYPDPESVKVDPMEGFYRRNAWTDRADTLFDKRMYYKKGRKPPRFKLLRQGALSVRHKFEFLLLLAIWGGCGVAASIIGFAGSEEPLALGISLGGAGVSVAALFFTLLF